jgi:hypothetical protein
MKKGYFYQRKGFASKCNPLQVNWPLADVLNRPFPMSVNYLLRIGGLAVTSLVCLTLLTACENNAPPDQLTVVQGTVTSADTGRPLPGVLMGVESFSRGLFGSLSFQPTGDSTRTNAQGKYELHFYNKKSLYYVVSFEPFRLVNSNAKPYVPSHYAFVTSTGGSSPGIGPASYELTLGRTNTVDFKPNELRTVAVRIRNRNTGYQRLDFAYRSLRGNNLDTLAYLTSFYPPTANTKFRYYNVNAAGTMVKDTLVALVFQNPAAPAPDTLRATLSFGR